MTIAYHRFETDDRYYGMSLQVNLLGEYEYRRGSSRIYHVFDGFFGAFNEMDFKVS
jgi:hypothetical protein